MRADQLRALAVFVAGLGELSNKTGVRITPHLGPCIYIEDEVLELTVDVDEDGVTYGVQQSR